MTRAGGVAAACATVLCPTATALADPPVSPIPAPCYSFDGPSPTVIASIVKGGDVLELAFPTPGQLVLASAMGSFMPTDNVDALSAANSQVTAQVSFYLLFSMSRTSVGAAQPDPSLVALGVPFNATDQATRQHAAGDQFMSTDRYRLSGEVGMSGNQTRLNNNILTRNNFDEGGTDFSALPETHADTILVGSPPLDCVDAMAFLDQTLLPLDPLYFSLSASSPSLAPLDPAAQSGATLFYRTTTPACCASGTGACCLPSATCVVVKQSQCMGAGGEWMGEGAACGPCGVETSDWISIFALPAQLGLLVGDDIDACVVFDRDSDGAFDTGDAVIFSLVVNSPSLPAINNGSPATAADIFIVRPGSAPQVLIPAASLGLGPADDIDALEIYDTAAMSLFPFVHGIRQSAN